MKSLSLMDEIEKNQFTSYFDIVPPLAGELFSSSLIGYMNVARCKLLPLHSDIKYVKFHCYLFISSAVRSCASLAAVDLQIKFDDDLFEALQNMVANFSFNCFNGNRLLCALPFFRPMNGQDVLLFRAIESASVAEGLSLFDCRDLSHKFGELCIKLQVGFDRGEEYESSKRDLFNLFGSMFLDSSRLERVDLNFRKIHYTTDISSNRSFVVQLERFMATLPDFVYHVHDNRTRYHGEYFSFICDCGARHYVEDCSVICDGGPAHYAVIMPKCKSAILKIESEGIFRIKGVKPTEKILASPLLLNLASEVVSSRKRIDD